MSVRPTRLPRTIRLDQSDLSVFEAAALPGEWAVSGAFAFVDADPAELTGKRGQAFKNGFLGVETFGRSTFVSVATVNEETYADVVETLAAQLLRLYGAPNPDAAREAAREELLFAASLCEHAPGTLLGVQRRFADEGIVESFRVVTPPAEGEHARVWDVDGPSLLDLAEEARR